MSPEDQYLTPAPTLDRRAAVRYPCHLTSRCGTDASRDACWPVTVLDLSATGARLLVPQPFAPRTVLILELPNARPPAPTTLLARVVHTRPDGDERWSLGCVFVSRLDPPAPPGIPGRPLNSPRPRLYSPCVPVSNPPGMLACGPHWDPPARRRLSSTISPSRY
jgi:hypothetical protein